MTDDVLQKVRMLMYCSVSELYAIEGKLLC